MQSPARADEEVPVLIVVGGGAGLTASMLLARLGVRHLLVSARPQTVLLVSNNPDALDQPVARGTRPALDTGQLGVMVVDAPANRPHPPARAWTAPDLEVAAPATVHAGIDGEAADLSGPLRFAIRPASLRVRISRHHPGASPSARFLPGARACAGLKAG